MEQTNETTKELSTLITRKHTQIGEEFLEMVAEMIKRTPNIKKYGVDAGMYYDQETITLEVSDKLTLSISTMRSK